MFEGYVFQRWMVESDNILVVFLGLVGFSDDIRLFMPLKMVLKIFKEMDIARYLFHEFLPFFQNFNLLFFGVVGSVRFSLTLFFSKSNSFPRATRSRVMSFFMTMSWWSISGESGSGCSKSVLLGEGVLWLWLSSSYIYIYIDKT